MPDRITFSCPKCGRSMRARAESAGKRVECPACHTKFQVPAPPARTEIDHEVQHRGAFRWGFGLMAGAFLCLSLVCCGGATLLVSLGGITSLGANATKTTPKK